MARLGADYTCGERALIFGGLAAGITVSAALAYFSLRLGANEKGILKTIGWTLGLPAAFSAVAGTAGLTTLAITGLPQRR